MVDFGFSIFDFRFGRRTPSALPKPGAESAKPRGCLFKSKIQNPKSKIAAALLTLVLALATTASAKTVVLTDEQADRMATFIPEAPLASWGGYGAGEGYFSTVFIDLRPGSAFLIRYPLDSIPKGMKITNAELMVQVYYLYSVEPRLYLWRLLPEWGHGACQVYRTQRPAKVEWAAPGARGGGADRATRPTVILPLTTPGEKVVNVTQDVELWYTGAAPNNGWLFTTEDAEANIRIDSPLWNARGKWKLRITYEPQ
jgi:hypothetical protein